MPNLNKTPWYVVLTPNPDLKPIQVFEIEHGSFASIVAARTLAKELAEAGHIVLVEERKWVIKTRDMGYSYPPETSDE